MNYLDMLFCILLIWAGYSGFRKGLIIELATLIALGGGLYLGILLSDFLSGLFLTYFGIKTSYLSVIIFSVIFLVVIVIVFWIGKKLEKVVKLVLLNWVNKLFGAAFGLLKGVLFIGIALLLLNGIAPDNPSVSDNKKESVLYLPLIQLSMTIAPEVTNSEFIKTATNYVVMKDSSNLKSP